MSLASCPKLPIFRGQVCESSGNLCKSIWHLAFKVNLCTGLTVCKRSYSQVFQDRPFFTSIIRSLLFTSVCAFSSIYLVWLIVWSRRRISRSGCLMVHRIDLPVALRLKELLGLISINMVLSSRWSMETNIFYSDFLPLYIYCKTDTDCLFAKAFNASGVNWGWKGTFQLR